MTSTFPRTLIATAIAIAIGLLSHCTTQRSADRSGMTTPPKLVPGDADAPSQITPSQSLEIAQKFMNHEWRPFARNILHGADPKGIIVNTPDAGFKDHLARSGWWLPGEVNRGIPYKWGGFDDPPAFDRQVGAGAAAGDVSSPQKRQADNAGVSEQAAGVDCSGFISRCLKLPSVHDTTQLPSLCRPIESQDLRPGDILNIPRGHVILCAGWARPDQSWIYFYETGGPPDYWKPGLKEAPLAALLELGYTPLRYRGMAYEPKTSGKEVLTRSAISKAATVT
ncbi:MAG: hypothetical protein NTV80_01085, partial [Verrucomicrobia bacterium]|nr:hypothetical protein [Verrucomicrobiota bacterium]